MYQPWHHNTAWLHVVHILQHSTSGPTTKPTHDTMGSSPKMNLLPHPAGTWGNSSKLSTRQHHQANECNSILDAEMVRTLKAQHCLRSRKKLSAENRWETLSLSNKEKDKWIVDDVDRETAVARKTVQGPETAIMQVQKDMRNAEKAGSTTTKPENIFEEMMYAIRDSLRNLACSDDEEDEKDVADDEEDTELGYLSEADEHSWVMCTISEMVKQHIETCWQTQMRLEEVTEPGWGDLADYFHEWDMKYETAELRVWQLPTPEQIRLQPHHPWWYLENSYRIVISDPNNHKCHKRFLDQEVVKWGGDPRNPSHTNAKHFSGLTQRLICHLTRIRSLLNP